MTEMASFGLLIPIMESSQSVEGFSNVPLLKWFSGLFSGMAQNEKLIWAASCMLVLTLIRGALLYVSEIATYSIPWRVDSHLRMKVYNYLHSASISYVEGMSASEQSDVTASNPVRIGVALRFVALFLANSFILLFNVSLMAIVSPVLTVSIVIMLAVLTAIYKWFTSRTLSKAGDDLTTATTRFSQAFYDTLNGMRVIRLSGSSSTANELVQDSIRGMKEANLKVLAVQAVVGPYFVTSVGIIFCVVLIGAASIGHGDNATILASLMATIYLMSRLLGPLTLINVSRAYVNVNLAAFNEMDRFLAEVRQNIEQDGEIELTDFQHEVQFSGVDFQYRGREEPTLKNLSLTIRKGERVGIVGLSGSGKSTVINLLARIYRPTRGDLLVDRNPLGDLRIESWWRQIAIVMQEMFFSNVSIRENLTRGLSQPPTDKEIWDALFMADAEEFVSQLPQGLDTKLADRGVGMSGGERQRLSLARALLRKPKFLILDEATSQLDVKTEATVVKRLWERTPGITMLVIAHRVGAVQMCDRIIILKEGSVVQSMDRSDEFSTGYPPLIELLNHDKPA